MAQTIRPLEGYLVIKPLDKPTETKSGILLPDEGGQRAEQGEVVAIGGPVWHDGGFVSPPRAVIGTDKTGNPEWRMVKAGDKVLFHPYGGREFEVDEVKYHLIPFYGDGRAMAVIEEAK